MKLTHIDEKGAARMVDVGAKDSTKRVAVAKGKVTMRPETMRLILDGAAAKGDVLQVARLAGIMAAKKTSDLIPLCHAIQIHSVEVDLTPDEETSTVNIRATASSYGKTGVEMEALTAAAVTGLTIYDMLKAVDRGMVIENVALLEKSGGKGGSYKRIENES